MCVFRVSQPPQTLAELEKSLKLLETLQADLSKIESQIPPIHEQFAILEKYEVPVDPAVSVAPHAHRHTLPQVFQSNCLLNTLSSPVSIPYLTVLLFDLALLDFLSLALCLSISVGVGVAGGSECRVGVVPAGCD